jgi:ATP-dependent helicase/nuclease subunit B
VSLELIVGAANSGRAGAVLDRFGAALEDDPLLVVPTGDDVERFERELCERPGGVLGGTVTSFPGLFAEVGRACGLGGGQPLSRIQRIWIARAASRRAELRILRRSAQGDGFAPALAALLADLQAAGLDASAFAARVSGLEQEAGYEAEVGRLFAAYERLRDGLGLGDAHLQASAATAALRGDPRLWRGRPVLLYGFDDLTREQIELLAALAAAGPVTIALAFEDRPALAARAELLGVLREELGAEVSERLSSERSHTESATLFHLERNLFSPEAETAGCDESLVLLESAGERSEAELIGRRIAELIGSGCEPDEIAVVVRSPDRQAPLLARVLAGLGIPIAAEAEIPLSQTATGATLLRLLAIAGGDGSAADVVAFLRGPARARPESVDWLERRLLRERLGGAEQALEAWQQAGNRIWPLEALAEAGESPARAAAAIGRIAAEIAERPHLRSGLQPSGVAAVELRAAAQIRAALTDAGSLGELAPAAAELGELLGHVRVPLWRGPTEGRVRILSPYRLRATRVAELFVAGLVDGSFPAPGGTDPLLGDQRRRELGLPARQDPAAEERYLFYICVSRPRRRLYLSYASADESGAALARSPFLDEVRGLLEPPPAPDPVDDELERRLLERIGIGDIAPPPERASSPRALARALAALPAAGAERQLTALELPAEVRDEVAAALRSARGAIAAAAAPGPLREPAVLDALGARKLYGASTLEQYDLCPYRWFVAHELDPQSIEPDPEPLETGGVAHAALEQLYRDAPGGRRPSERTLERWVRAARAQLRASAEQRGWDLASSRARIALARLDAVLERFLRREASTAGPMEPDPELLEAAFGAGPDDAYPPADIGSFELHGKIDRVDVSADGKALVRDYKLSAKVVAGKRLLREGRLQLPLYMHAVKGMGLEPIGGLYHPLAATRHDRPRGLLVEEQKDDLIPGGVEAHYGTDFMPAEAIEAIVTEALDRAREIVAGIGAGRIERAPRDGRCPTWCGYAPICRMERGVVDEDEEEAPS